jgi:transposase
VIVGYASIAKTVAQSHMRRRPVMRDATRFVGLDVHADTIAVAVAEPGRGEVRSLGIIPNDASSVRKLIQKLGKKDLKVCYEAGPTGFALYWQLAELGIECEVIAPTLIPKKAGERIKTDRRDAAKLARCYRAGDLTPIWIPDQAHEALRDLVRAREAAKYDQHRARQRLGKFLLRAAKKPPPGNSSWSVKYVDWIRTLKFEHVAQQATLIDYLAEVDHASERIARLEKAIEDAILQASPQVQAVIAGLQALRGVAKLSAVTLAVEIGSFSRFETAKQLMAYCGVVPSEHSSGNSRRQGAITKTGNAHVRRVLFEASWGCRHRPNLGTQLKQRQRGLSAAATEIAWKAQHRLHRRYLALSARGKPSAKVMGAVGRELLGFIWAVAVQIEREHAACRLETKEAA